MMSGVMRLYEVSLLYYQMTNIAVNRNLASVINNWNNSSKSFYELIVIYIFASKELLIWFNKVWFIKTCQWNFFKFVKHGAMA